MKKYVLDISRMSRSEAHAYIAAKMRFPDFYGANLDALFDMLCSTEAAVTLYCSRSQLPFARVFGDASRRMHKFHATIVWIRTCC